MTTKSKSKLKKKKNGTRHSRSSKTEGHRYQEGHAKMGGRKVGTPNKITAECKEIIAQAFEGLGGLQAMIKWARKDNDNLTAFYTRIYVKLLPMVLNVNRGSDTPSKLYPTAAEIQQHLQQLGLPPIKNALPPIIDITPNARTPDEHPAKSSTD